MKTFLTIMTLAVLSGNVSAYTDICENAATDAAERRVIQDTQGTTDCEVISAERLMTAGMRPHNTYRVEFNCAHYPIKRYDVATKISTIRDTYQVCRATKVTPVGTY